MPLLPATRNSRQWAERHTWRRPGTPAPPAWLRPRRHSRAGRRAGRRTGPRCRSARPGRWRRSTRPPAPVEEGVVTLVELAFPAPGQRHVGATYTDSQWNLVGTTSTRPAGWPAPPLEGGHQRREVGPMGRGLAAAGRDGGPRRAPCDRASGTAATGSTNRRSGPPGPQQPDGEGQGQDVLDPADVAAHRRRHQEGRGGGHPVDRSARSARRVAPGRRRATTRRRWPSPTPKSGPG